MFLIRWRTLRAALLRVCMEQSSNSLLGKAVRSRRALHSVGNALLNEQAKPVHAEAIDLRPESAMYPPESPQQTPVYQERHARNDVQSDAWVPLVDPRKLFKAIANAKKLIALTSLAGLALGIALAISTPKYYYSTAEILIDPRDLQISDRELLPTGLPYDASLALVENQTRILTSRRVILGTVEKLNLDQDAEYNGKGLGSPGPITALKQIAFGSESDDPSKAKELAVENLLKATGVSRTPKTFVISLTIQSQSPDKAALIANTMAEVYMDVQDEIQSDTVGRANGELGGRLEELRADVEKAERLVEAYRSENELFDANGKLISDDEISLSSTQLTRAREKVAELRARADSARELTLDAVLSDALPEGAASNLIAELRRGYALKVQQRDALAEKLGAQHPQLRTAEAEVTSAQRGIETELRRLSQTAQIELQRAIKTEQDLAAGQARLKSKKSSISESLVRLRELEREAGARRSVYESFLLRARETGQQAGISTANTTIVSQAVPALRPYGTSRKIIAAGGLVGGFMFGLMLALMGALWRAFTHIEPERGTYYEGENMPRNETGNAQPTAPVRPAPSGGGTKVQPQNSAATDHDNSNQNPAQGGPMYYPYPQPGMLNGMMMAPVPQQPMMPQMMPQPMMPQMMMQPVIPQHMMQPSPYGYPMMQQPMMQQPAMPQMMQHYPYGHQPMMPQHMMQPVMHQPVVQPVYVAMPQQQMSQPVYQPPQQPAPMPHVAPQQNDSDYSEIRGRLQALRDGIVNLADGRERLSKLG
jgi:polysaccharide biosynthesis transport protein